MAEHAMTPGWRTYRFDQMAVNVNERVEPSETDLEHYVGLEHLAGDSPKLRRWGTPEDVDATKLLYRTGDIIIGRRRVYPRKLAVAEFNGICSAFRQLEAVSGDAVRSRNDTSPGKGQDASKYRKFFGPCRGRYSRNFKQAMSQFIGEIDRRIPSQP